MFHVEHCVPAELYVRIRKYLDEQVAGIEDGCNGNLATRGRWDRSQHPLILKNAMSGDPGWRSL
jgi:hypothetical protein